MCQNASRRLRTRDPRITHRTLRLAVVSLSCWQSKAWCHCLHYAAANLPVGPHTIVSLFCDTLSTILLSTEGESEVGAILLLINFRRRGYLPVGQCCVAVANDCGWTEVAYPWWSVRRLTRDFFRERNSDCVRVYLQKSRAPLPLPFPLPPSLRSVRPSGPSAVLSCRCRCLDVLVGRGRGRGRGRVPNKRRAVSFLR